MSENRHKSRNLFFVIDDALMMITLTLNLALLLFETIYAIDIVEQLFEQHTPVFNQYYQTHIHTNFHTIDLGFVIFFLSEFFLSWVVAIYYKWHEKWYFYPFIHWYDLLGCIPIGSFRFLRVLRVFSITIRLHKAGYINIRHTVVYQQLNKYYGVFLEEVSDRVVVNVLTGLQEEIRDGGHIFERIVSEVLMPNQQILVEWLSDRLSYSVAVTYKDKKEDLNSYVKEVVHSAFSKNNAIEMMSSVPVLGSKMAYILEDSISNVVFNAIDKGVSDLGSEKNRAIVEEGVEIAFGALTVKEDKAAIQKLLIDTFVEVIEIMKDQVKVKKWKENF